MKDAALSVILSFLFVAAATAQTFTGTVIDGSPDAFLFQSDAAGQYQATLTWEDDADRLLLSFVCEDDQGALQMVGISGGFRDRVARLSLGITGERLCAVGVTLIDLLIADYTLNFQATTAGAASPALRKMEISEVPDELYLALDGTARGFRSLRETVPAPVKVKAGPTTTVLAQIRGGIPQDFVIDAADDVLELTAMWNRMDTDLSVSMTCGAGDTVLDWGTSESGQERFLRFDADVLAGSTCTVTLSSPNTMVYALNIAFYGEAGAL